MQRIVKDGIKERVTSQHHQESLVHCSKTVMEEYEQKIFEELLPLLIDDYGKDIIIKLS